MSGKGALPIEHKPAPAQPDSRLRKVEPAPQSSAAPAQTRALQVLMILAIGYTAYFAAQIVIPICAAALLFFLFSPVVHWMVRWRLPRTAAAILVTALSAAAIGGTLYALTAPAAAWLERAPSSIEELRERFRDAPNPLDNIRQVSDAVEEAVEDITRGDSPPREAATAVEIAEPDLPDRLIEQIPALLLSLGLTLVLTMFLLISGDDLLRKLVASGRTLSTRRRIVTTARQIEADIGHYLATITLINAALAAVVAGAMYLLGLPNPWLWGALAGALNFAPYLGPLVCTFVILMASIEISGSLGSMLTPPLVYLAITSIEGQLVTPLLVGRRLKLSPLVVLLAVVVAGWMWGLVGALIAVPIVASVRICLSNLPNLGPLGRFLAKSAGPEAATDRTRSARPAEPRAKPANASRARRRSQ